MDPPAVVGLGNAFKLTGNQLDGVVTDITSAEFLSGLQSGLTGNVSNLADMTGSAGNQLIDRADGAAGFQLPGITPGPGAVGSNISSPSNSGPNSPVPATTVNAADSTNGTINLVPAVPASPIASPTKGGTTPAIGSGPGSTTLNPGTQAATGITAPPSTPVANTNAVAIPPIKGASTTPVTNQNPAGQSAMGIAPNPSQMPAGLTPVAIPPVKGPTTTATTTHNPGAQSAMGIAPNPGQMPTGLTPVAIPPIKGPAAATPIITNPHDPWAGYDSELGEFGGIDARAIAANQDRINALKGQGFSEADALAFVLTNGSPSEASFGTPTHLTSLTVGELNYLASTWEEKGKSDNDPILDAIVRELNNRADMAAGESFFATDLQALAVSEAMGLDYDAVDTALKQQEIERLSQTIATVNLPPGAREAMSERVRELAADLTDDSAAAAQLAAALQSGGGSTVAEATALIDYLDASDMDTSPADVARFNNQINALQDDDFDLNQAALTAIVAQKSGLDKDAIKQAQLDYGDDPVTAAMRVQAHELGLTLEQLQAEIVINENAALVDTAHQTLEENKTDAVVDSFTSLEDYEAIVNNPDGMDPALVAAAQTMLDRAANDEEFAAAHTKTSLFDSFVNNYVKGESQLGGVLIFLASRGTVVTSGAEEFGHNLIKDDGYLENFGDAANQIMTIVPGSPHQIHLLLTDPGQLADNYASFGLGVKDFAVDTAKIGGALVIAGNPMLNAMYEDLTGTNVRDEVNAALIGLGEQLIVDPDAMVSAMIGYELMQEDPLRWAGQVAPEIVIEVVTGGTAAAAFKGTDAVADAASAANKLNDAARVTDTFADTTGNASKITDAADLAEDFNGLLPDYRPIEAIDPVEIPSVFHYTDQKYVDSILEGGLRPGTFTTPNGDLGGLGAVVELALPPNRPLPNAVIEIDVAAATAAGIDIPAPSRVTSTVTDGNGQVFQMPGGGLESQIPLEVPPEFLSSPNRPLGGGPTSPGGGTPNRPLDGDDFPTVDGPGGPGSGSTTPQAYPGTKLVIRGADDAPVRFDPKRGPSPKIEPNTTYATPDYTFVTDAQGRPIRATGELKLETGTRTPEQTRIGKLGIDGDEGGHLIGAQFNGPPDAFNLTPQAGSLNRGPGSEWAQLERDWADELANGAEIEVTIEVVYDSSDGLRPSAYQIEWTIDGFTDTVTLNNTGTGS